VPVPTSLNPEEGFSSPTPLEEKAEDLLCERADWVVLPKSSVEGQGLLLLTIEGRVRDNLPKERKIGLLFP